MSELPEGWAAATLRDAVDDYETIDPKASPNEMFSYVDIGTIDNSAQKITAPKEFHGRDAPSRARRVVRTNDVLFSTVRTYLKNVAQVQPELDGQLTSTGICVLRANEAVDPGYLFRWIGSDAFIDEISKAQDGTMYPAVRDDDVLSGPIPLPPLAEQKRIVTKLDTLSARTTAARTHLTTIEKLVERYRDQVVKAAYSGRLTSPTEDRHSFKQEGLWDLPERWEWRTIEEVAEIQLALTPVADIQELPHIAPDNIEKNTGRLLPYNTIAEDEVISAKHRFYQGQIVYSKIRPYLRKAILPEFDGACSADMYPVRPRDCCDIEYLFYWLLSTEYAYFAGLSEGRTVLPKINKKQMNASPIPWCPIDEQIEIVRHIETAFKRIDRLASEAEKAVKLTDQLDQSILSKTFNGELVPQDPNDEPASVFLDRIREARASAPKKTHPRRTKATAMKNAPKGLLHAESAK